MDSPVPLNYNNITVSIMLLMMCLSIIVILLSDRNGYARQRAGVLLLHVVN